MVESGASGEIIEKKVRVVFIGEYQHVLDPKGRVIMPSKFRDGLGEKFVVTKGWIIAYLFIPKMNGKNLNANSTLP